jgi:hypothetical protein
MWVSERRDIDGFREPGPHESIWNLWALKAVRSVRCATRFNVSSQDRRASCSDGLLADIWAKHATNFIKMLQFALYVT